ncbi:MAG: tripartite tricarboxylate transporter permease [Pseudomonadota bacterium]|nr:tripartite tricarboxylate transporter permease [Pseudomonadota bacterium]
MLDAAYTGLIGILQWKALALMMVGIVISSTLVAMPGIGSKTAIALLLPIAFVLNKFEAICLIMSVWAVSNTANSITSILFSVPGGGGSQATIMDGYPMAQKGEAARALAAAFTSSAIGGIIGAIVLFAAIPVLRPLVLLLGPPEFFMLVMVGIAMVGALSGKAPVKGIIAGGIGLMVSMVGVHIITGIHRFTFDTLFLTDGFKLIPVTIGLFAIPELLYMAVKGTGISDLPLGDLKTGRKQGIKDAFIHWWLVVRSSFIGVWVGVIPGLGSAVADWFAYGSAKQTCPGARETFGTGDVRGVIAVDAATNAKEGGSLIPTLAFGIPGSSTLALIFGGLIIVGITPGRDMLTKDLHLTFSMIWLLIIGSVITSILCLAFTRQLAMATKLRPSLMIPVILAMAAIGSFAASSRFEDVIVMLIFGTIGYFMRSAGWPRPPLLLGLVLGPIAERYMWTSVQLFGGEFLLRPGVLIIFALLIACILYPVYQDRKSAVGTQESGA